MRFLLETIAELRAAMRRMGSELIIRIGKPEQILPELTETLGIDRFHFVEEPGSEERSIERAVINRMQTNATGLSPETLLEIEDPGTFARELPEVFSSFRRHVEKRLDYGQPRPAPERLRPVKTPADFESGEIPTLDQLGLFDEVADPRGVMQFRGGESSGLERLEQWMFHGDHLQHYKQTRNEMLGPEYSSKFSPWLAVGALSSRQVAARSFSYEEERTKNESTYWLRFELLWREFFRLHLLKHGASLFHRTGPIDLDLEYRNDPEMFEHWRNGTTGIPLIDANMRELKGTGFMSNRGRQIVASFLSKNMNVDWRWGARWFERCLIDYCPAANWGNWSYSAGVGADPRGFRGFDIARQARSYDPRGDYVAKWLPEEVGHLDGMSRHAPWDHGGPTPVVETSRSLDEARVRWEAASMIHRTRLEGR